VLTTSFTLDYLGASYAPRETVARIARASAGPVYSPLVSDPGQGLVAWSPNGGFEHGRVAARLAGAVLGGGRPADLPVESHVWKSFHFDYQQLQRFGVDDARLPADAVVIGRPASFYRDNRRLIWGVGLFMLGQALVIAAFASNVVRRRRAERHLAQAESDLRQSQKMDAVGRLAGGIAHDFNNLLTVINGYSELLLQSPEDLPGAAGRSSVQEIRRAGEQAAALTRQLLAFSRKQLLQVSVVDLNRVVSELETMLGRLIGERVTFYASLDPSLACINVDASQIEQVIVNLVVNARDAMPQGGRIVVTTRNEVVDERTAARIPGMSRGSYVVLSVADSGIGMDRATQSQIFEPFFTTKGKTKGTGLGLATVYGIVRQSGGWIDVLSELHEGTTFTLYFPPSDEAVPPLELPRAFDDAPAERVRQTVVVVEDQHEVRELASSALRRAGYDVLEASDGQEAIALCEEFSGAIDLLLTDVVMPGVNGRELAERLRRHRPDLKVIFISGYSHEILGPEGVLATEGAVLLKPFTPSVLVARVRKELYNPNRSASQPSPSSSGGAM
jgi:signal transduction histidine kinase